jgi:hypothetical protein
VLAKNESGAYHYIDVTFEEDPIPLKGKPLPQGNAGVLLGNICALIREDRGAVDFYDTLIHEHIVSHEFGQVVSLQQGKEHVFAFL